MLSAGAVQGSEGQDVEVPVKIKGAKDLKSLEVRLSCDPAVLEVEKVEAGEPQGPPM